MSVEVKLELGHRANLREKPTAEGFTHDWTVFVRGAEGSNIQHFVDKVVFQLHESFPKPKRVVKEAPYQVSESGYAGFTMPIEVYFRSKEEPKKVKFEYDLYLRLENSPVSNIRLEKLTFQNPSDDFRRKLLKAGGVGAASSGTGSVASLQTQACAPTEHVEESLPPPVNPKGSVVVAEKKPRSHHLANKEIAKSSLPAPKPKEPFTDAFGAPLKTKTSPDSLQVKDIAPSNQQKSKISPVSTLTPKPVTKETHSTETKVSKPPKLDREVRSSKRLPPVDTQIVHGGSEKKKRHISASSENSDKASESSKAKVKDGKDKNEKPKGKVSGSVAKKEKEKPKGKSNSSAPPPVVEMKEKPKLAVIKQESPIPPSPLDSDSNDSKRNCNKAQYSSPASSISETSLDANRPLSSMMSEIDHDGLSPMTTSDPELSPYPPSLKDKRNSDFDMDNDSPEPKLPPKVAPPQPLKCDSKKPQVATKPPLRTRAPPAKNNSNHGNSTGMKDSGNLNDSLSPTNNDLKVIEKENALDREELMELQQKIMSSNDRQMLQKVVDVIEKTGKYQMSSSSFDFDLCALDHLTVRKLKLCLTT